MLRTLRKERIGTSGVESLTKRLCSHPVNDFKESSRVKIVKIVMKKKLGDAYRCYERSKYTNNKVWREVKKNIRGDARRDFMNVWHPYIVKVRKKFDDDAEKKVEWLRSKWKPDDVVPDIYEGVVVKSSDKLVYDNAPRTYGSVELTEVEKASLSLRNSRYMRRSTCRSAGFV